MKPQHSTFPVHLVGSVPLANAEEVFRTAAMILGERVQRLPDGETGVRSDWIGWQFPVLQETPYLVYVPPAPGRYAARPHVKLDPALGDTPLTIGPLGYAEAARASYALFTRLQDQNVLPADMRFQVSLPPPLDVITAFVERPDRVRVEQAYEQRMLAELDEIVAAIPHTKLAIQWDMPMEMGILEGVIPSHLDNPRAQILERLQRLSTHIPAGVEVGYHLCYGDNAGRHFKQPQDTGLMVDFANALTTTLDRPIGWFHMPVPQDRSDDAYFAPLRNLVLAPATSLYLGLVHDKDGVEGTRQRVATAQHHTDQFGIATECGFGRRQPETIVDLLKLHAQVAEL